MAVSTMVVPMQRYRFIVDQYERMGTAGILAEVSRVELINGEIIAMSPIEPRHADCVAMLTRLLARQAPDTVLVAVQNPIRLPDATEPQPDLSLLRFARYTRTLPIASDALVVVEVSDTTLDYDRQAKLPLYAAAGIPEAWLVDLGANRIERHTEPGPDGYHLIARFGVGSDMESVILPEIVVSVDTIFGLGA